MKSCYQLKITGFSQKSIQILNALTPNPELFVVAGQSIKDTEGRLVTYRESLWSYTSHPFAQVIDAYSGARSIIVQNWRLLKQVGEEAKVVLVFVIEIDPNEGQNISWEIDNNFQRLLWEIEVSTIYRIEYQQV